MKLENPSTCEDCLSFLVKSGKMESIDRTILRSIDRQLSRETAMTDRQFAVVKQKLLTYGRLWTEHNIDIRKHVNVLKYPLREIDRSHWIKLLEYNGEEVIGIRFPFNKKVIDRIEELRRLDTHNQKSHYYKDNVHCFPLTPKNIFEIVEIANRFSTKFAVQDDIINIYNQLLEYENNRNWFERSDRDKRPTLGTFYYEEDNQRSWLEIGSQYTTANKQTEGNSPKFEKHLPITTYEDAEDLGLITTNQLLYNIKDNKYKNGCIRITGETI